MSDSDLVTLLFITLFAYSVRNLAPKIPYTFGTWQHIFGTFFNFLIILVWYMRQGRSTNNPLGISLVACPPLPSRKPNFCRGSPYTVSNYFRARFHSVKSTIP